MVMSTTKNEIVLCNFERHRVVDSAMSVLVLLIVLLATRYKGGLSSVPNVLWSHPRRICKDAVDDDYLKKEFRCNESPVTACWRVC
jgi:hypothetical protein